jgi:D-alanyl-D-alanine carboxypeptidase
MIIENNKNKNKGLLYFLVAFLASSFFFVAINGLGKGVEDYFFFREVAQNPELFMAQANLKNILPESKNENEKVIEPKVEPEIIVEKNLEISAKSAISVLFNPDTGDEKTLFEKESNTVLPIASLTKLMLADVVLENYDLNKIIKISSTAVSQAGDIGNLKVGEELSVENLLYMALIESNNDAAYALSEALPKGVFVHLMNLEANYLGMTNTFFEDPMGISGKNQSNTKDLVILIKHLLKEQPLVWEILKKPEFDLKTPDGVFHHKLINTNETLREWGINLEIVGGKTGYTSLANGCFALVLKVVDNGYLINVILGSNDRFNEMIKLTDFVQKNAGLSY